MRAAFDRVLTLDQVEQRYAGATTLPTPPSTRCRAPTRRRRRQPLVGRPQPASSSSPSSPPHRARSATATASRRQPGTPPTPWRCTGTSPTGATSRTRACSPTTSGSGSPTPAPPTRRSDHRAAASTPGPMEPITAQLYLYDPAAFDGDGAVAVPQVTWHRAKRRGHGPGPRHRRRERSLPGRADSHDLRVHPLASTAPSGSASMFWIGYDAPDNLPWEGEGWDAGGSPTEAMAAAGGERLADTARRPPGLARRRPRPPDRHRAQLRLDDHRTPPTTTGSPSTTWSSSAAPASAETPTAPAPPASTPTTSGPAPTAATSSPTSATTAGGTSSPRSVPASATIPPRTTFGARRFQAESTTRGDVANFDDHSKYFDHGSESLYNISQIVNGNYDAVLHAGPSRTPGTPRRRTPSGIVTPRAPDPGRPVRRRPVLPAMTLLVALVAVVEPDQEMTPTRRAARSARPRAAARRRTRRRTGACWRAPSECSPAHPRVAGRPLGRLHQSRLPGGLRTSGTPARPGSTSLRCRPSRRRTSPPLQPVRAGRLRGRGPHGVR